MDQLFQKSDLIPVIIQDADTLEVLMLGFTNREAVELTLKTKTAWFWSRSRQKLWNKGESSGHFLHVKRVVAPTATPIPCSISASRTGPPATPAAAAAFSTDLGGGTNMNDTLQKPLPGGAGPEEQAPGGLLHLLSL